MGTVTENKHLMDLLIEAAKAFNSMRYEPPESRLHKDRLAAALLGMGAALGVVDVVKERMGVHK